MEEKKKKKVGQNVRQQLTSTAATQTHSPKPTQSKPTESKVEPQKKQ